MRFWILGFAFTSTVASAAGLQIQPGQWQFTGRVVEAEIPGAPPGILEMMNKRQQVRNVCITPEQAARDPKAIFEQSKGRCTYSKFEMARGKLSLLMTCRGSGTEGQATMSVATIGTYTLTSYRTHSVMNGKGPRGTMKIVSEGQGKRIGACK